MKEWNKLNNFINTTNKHTIKIQIKSFTQSVDNTKNIDMDEDIDKQWQLGMKKFYEGNISDALGIINQALIEAQDMKLYKSLVAGYLNLAHIYMRMDDIEQAIRFLKHASDAAERVEPGYKKGVILPMMVRYMHEHAIRLVNDTNNQEDLQEALTYFNDSLKISEKANNNLLIGESLEQKGNVLCLMGSFEEALDCLIKSLDIFHNNKMTPKEYMVCRNITYILTKLSRWEDTIKYHQRRIHLSNTWENKNAEISAQIDLATSFYHLKNYGEASHNCRLTLRNAKSIKDEKALMSIYHLLMKISIEISATEQEKVFREKMELLQLKTGLDASKFDYTEEYLRVMEKK